MFDKVIKKLNPLNKKDEIVKLTDEDFDYIVNYLKFNESEIKEFEKLYKKSYKKDKRNLAKMSKDDFEINNISNEDEKYNFIIDNIVKEMANNTVVYDSETDSYNCESEEVSIIEPFMLNELEDSLKPQFLLNYSVKDISDKTIDTLVQMYLNFKKTGNKKIYSIFRIGLDTLDLDYPTYVILGRNKNAMSNWLPQMVRAVKNTNFFKIPKTKIIKVPIGMLQSTRVFEYNELTQGSRDVINRYCKKVFKLEDKDYFVKTGTFSSKFFFRNAKVEKNDIDELGLYLWLMSSQAVQMSSFLNNKSVYGVSTTNEWVVRDFIEDEEDRLTIYNGLPLRCEFRIFVDFDTKKVVGSSPYWREDVMTSNFRSKGDSDSIHDAITYGIMKDKLNEEYNDNVDLLISELEKVLPFVELEGQYSIDVMKNGKDFYIIDMALACESALSDVIETQLKHDESKFLDI